MLTVMQVVSVEVDSVHTYVGRSDGSGCCVGIGACGVGATLS